MIRVSTANLYLNSTNMINADQSALMTTEAELASGKQVNSPSDNPVGFGEATLLQSNISQLSQYGSNQSQATQLLNNASSTVGQAVNVLQSVQTSLVEAGNGSMNAADRSDVAAQLQQDFNQLVGLANSSDDEGGYLFGGSVNSTPPFVQSGNNVAYVGDDIVSSVQISQTRSEQTKYSGSSVFLQVPSGNGTFATSAASTNTGSGTIDVGSVTNPSALTGDDYQIQFSVSGSPATTTYSIVDTTTGQPPATGPSPATGTFTSPMTLSFDGMQVTVSGAPANGDSFSVVPSTNQSMFSILAGAISALQAQNSAGLSTALNGVGQAITSLSTTQASMGSQLQELNTYSTVNSDRNTQDETQLSSIVDLDYAQGVSQMTQQQTQYQAALQSYADISKLSLFNYI